MQTNAMKQALARGETQVGVWINMVRNPAILRLMKSAGLDFARFDMEHASPSMETLSNMALLARAMDFTLTVRPPQGNREMNTTVSRLQISASPCWCGPTVCTAQPSPVCVRRWRNEPGYLAPGAESLRGAYPCEMLQD